MKKLVLTFTIIISFFAIFTSCGNNASEKKAESTTAQQTANAMYQCPMKCEGEKMYEKPGQCPVCNMDLKQVEGGHEQHNHDSTHTDH